MDGDSGVAVLDPPTLPLPGGHYSHVSIAGGLVFVAGQLPIRPDGSKLVGASFEEQVRQVLANLGAALAAAGSSVDRLAQVRVFVDHIDHWPMFDAIYKEWAGTSKPARTVLATGSLHFGLSVEVDAIALAGPA